METRRKRKLLGSEASTTSKIERSTRRRSSRKKKGADVMIANDNHSASTATSTATNTASASAPAPVPAAAPVTTIQSISSPQNNIGSVLHRTQDRGALTIDDTILNKTRPHAGFKPEELLSLSSSLSSTIDDRSQMWDEYVANIHENEFEAKRMAQMAAETDPVLISRNVIPDIWHYICGLAIVIYVSLVLVFRGLFIWSPEVFSDSSFREVAPAHTEEDGSCGTSIGTTVADGVLSWQDDDKYKNISWISMTALLLTGIKKMISLLNNGLDKRRRSVLYCVITVNLISAHSHFLIATGALPVWRSCFGRTMHAARWAEWTALVILMMVIMVALDCSSKTGIIRRAAPQALSVIFGLASTLCCQVGDEHGHCAYFDRLRDEGTSEPWSFSKYMIPSGRTRSFDWNIALLLVSCICFLDIFNLLRESLVSKLHTVASAQAVLLTCACTVTWSCFVVVYLLGMLNLPWFDFYRESCAYTITDVLAKILYAEILCTVHLSNLSPEEWYKAELVLKEKANEAQRHFLRYVFHEVRVPLNTIQLGLESVQQAGGMDNETEYVMQCMEEAVSTMSETLNDVLSYQKIEEGRVEISLAPLNLHDLVRNCGIAFETSLRDKNLGLSIYIGDECVSKHATLTSNPVAGSSCACRTVPEVIVGDSLRVRQVLNNFLSNAIKFTEPLGHIAIHVKVMDGPLLGEEQKSPGAALSPLRQSQAIKVDEAFSKLLSSDSIWLEFSVTDSGCGIAADDMRKLFNAFTQIRAGDLQMGRGSGLGLCICKHMVQMLQGRIGVRSCPKVGSCFFFRMPFAIHTDDYSYPTTSSSQVQGPSLLPSHSLTSAMQRPTFNHRGTAHQDMPHTSSGIEPLDRSSILSTSQVSSRPLSSSFDVGSSTQKEVVESGTRILIVDDVTTNRKMIRRCVQQLGFECDLAENGREAVEMWEKATLMGNTGDSNGYSLILMDNVMPNMTGVEATEKIRQLERHIVAENETSIGRIASTSSPRFHTRGRALIFGLTGNALSEDVAEFKNAGCDEVLTKPLSMARFKVLLDHHGLLRYQDEQK